MQKAESKISKNSLQCLSCSHLCAASLAWASTSAPSTPWSSTTSWIGHPTLARLCCWEQVPELWLVSVCCHSQLSKHALRLAAPSYRAVSVKLQEGFCVFSHLSLTWLLLHYLLCFWFCVDSPWLRFRQWLVICINWNPELFKTVVHLLTFRKSISNTSVLVQVLVILVIIYGIS